MAFVVYSVSLCGDQPGWGPGQAQDALVSSISKGNRRPCTERNLQVSTVAIF